MDKKIIKKPKIIKVMEERTGKKYYDLYYLMKIIEWNKIIFNNKVDCECGKVDLTYISKIEIDNIKYDIGSVCIKHINQFLKDDLINDDHDIEIKQKIEKGIIQTKILIENFDKAIKQHKDKIKKFKEYLTKQEIIIKNTLNYYEKDYLNLLDKEFSIERNKLNDDTFKIGKYTNKKYYQIKKDGKDNIDYLFWILKEDKNNNLNHKWFSTDLVNNIKSYMKKYYIKYIKK